MSIVLSKGQKIDLTKGRNLVKAVVALGWQTQKYKGNSDFDLDASAFLLGSNDKCVQDHDFIFYNNLEHPSKCLKHTGDDRTGGDGNKDDEQLILDFSKMPEYVTKIAFTVTIHDAGVRRQNFGQVNNAFIRLFDESTGEELLRYDLSDDFALETAVVFAEIYKENGNWRFNAIGSGIEGDLATLVTNYGLTV